MTCPKCSAPLLDMGTWPQPRGPVIQGWKCVACDKIIKTPVRQ